MSKWMTTIVALAFVASPVLAANRTTDFDVADHDVKNQVAGGKVKVTEISKVEAVQGDDIVSETMFFFPAPAEKIAAQLSEPDQMCKLAAFCKGVKKIGDTADGKGWVGEMTINAGQVTKTLGAKSLWVADMKNATKQHGEYGLQFELRKVQTGNTTELQFRLLKGRVFSKLDMVVRVTSGGPSASTVTIQSTSNSKLGSNVSDRVTLAKRIIRDSAAVLDRAMTN
jgi:hypothetical protein